MWRSKLGLVLVMVEYEECSHHTGYGLLDELECQLEVTNRVRGYEPDLMSQTLSTFLQTVYRIL